MNVGDFMHRGAHSCRDDDTLQHAARIMRDHKCGFLVLVDDGGRIDGVVTDRDLCLALASVSSAQKLSEILVRAALSKSPLVAVRASDDIAHAEVLMRTHRLHRLPVLDDEGRPIGVLSLSDLARAAAPGWTPEAGDVTPASVIELLASIDRSTA